MQLHTMVPLRIPSETTLLHLHLYTALGGAYDFCMEDQCDYLEQTNPSEAIEYIKLCFMTPAFVLLADTKIAGEFHKSHMAIYQQAILASCSLYHFPSMGKGA